MSYFHGEEYDSAARTFSSFKEKHANSVYVAPSEYFEGLSCWRQKKYEEAKGRFDALVHLHPNTEYAPRALAAKSLIGIDEENTAASRNELQRLIDAYPADKTAANAADALRLLNEYDRLPEKSTIAAGLLSAVLPGSGYAYAGNYEDGITAFSVNALFIAGTMTAVHQRNYTTAYLAGAFGLPFYIGNIYGSANAARKWNIRVRQEQRRKISAALEFSF